LKLGGNFFVFAEIAALGRIYPVRYYAIPGYAGNE
jgi:hypothetical protein